MFHLNEEGKMQCGNARTVFRSILVILLVACLVPDAYADAPANTAHELYLKAQASWEKGEWENALNLCDGALKVNKRHKEAWLLKGQIFWQMKNHKMALSSFDEYLRIDPKSASVWVNRAANLFELERYKEMQESFQKAQEIDPNYPPLYKTMGVNYLLMGNFEDAHNAFQKLEQFGETSVYSRWTERMLRIISESHAPPANWIANPDSYQMVLEITDSAKTGYLVNLSSTTGTSIRFTGSADAPFRYVPNFEVWSGTMIFDRKGDGLLTNGTHFRYTKIAGDTKTIEEGQINNWRLDLSTKKCYLLGQ